MTIHWSLAYGEYQLPFMGAANRVLNGESRLCPKCNGELRAYFHVFQSDTGKGTLWVWCGGCGMHTTLPRVSPPLQFPDPFAGVPRGQFSALETSAEERLLDRLERLWSEGALRRAD